MFDGFHNGTSFKGNPNNLGELIPPVPVLSTMGNFRFALGLKKTWACLQASCV